jgi:hypothetical protein
VPVATVTEFLKRFTKLGVDSVFSVVADAAR